MKAVVLKEFGGPENLAMADLLMPRVEPGAAAARTEMRSTPTTQRVAFTDEAELVRKEIHS
jgi:hypothetical protein